MNKKFLALVLLAVVSITLGTNTAVYSTEYFTPQLGFSYSIISFPINLTSPSPANSSINQPLNPTLSIAANHSLGGLMNISFWTNAGGSWQRLGDYHEGYNGTYVDTNATDMDEYDTLYYWSVNCTDGTYWKNETYHFTTLEE